MKVYRSKNTDYRFSGIDLIGGRGDEQIKLLKPIYALDDNIEALLKKHKISARREVSIEKTVGDAFIEELGKKSMDLNQTGGRFVALITEGEIYNLFYTSKIREIRDVEDKKPPLKPKVPNYRHKPLGLAKQVPPGPPPSPRPVQRVDHKYDHLFKKPAVSSKLSKLLKLLSRLNFFKRN